jgi:hypothetical protein
MENKEFLMFVEIAKFNAEKALSLLPDNAKFSDLSSEYQSLTNAIFELDTVLGKV